jgi:hypothetical protein
MMLTVSSMIDQNIAAFVATRMFSELPRAIYGMRAIVATLPLESVVRYTSAEEYLIILT